MLRFLGGQYVLPADAKPNLPITEGLKPLSLNLARTFLHNSRDLNAVLPVDRNVLPARQFQMDVIPPILKVVTGKVLYFKYFKYLPGRSEKFFRLD